MESRSQTLDGGADVNSNLSIRTSAGSRHDMSHELWPQERETVATSFQPCSPGGLRSKGPNPAPILAA